MRKYETEGGPPPKKKYLHYDRLLFLAPYVYGGAGYKPPPDNAPKPPDDAQKPPDVQKNSDDVQKPIDDVSQLLEIIYGEDDELDDDNSKRKSPTVTTSDGNPEDDGFALKYMRIKLPEKWTSDRNGTKSSVTSIDGTTRIPDEELANEREASLQTVTTRGPVISNVTSISASTTAQNSNFVYDSVPMYSDERNLDKHGNQAFLLSFVPIMDSLPPQLSLQARLKITEVFNDLVSNIPPQQGFYTQQ